MITANAESGICELFSKAIRGTIVNNPEDYCEIDPITLDDDLEKDRKGKFAVMTIAASTFKLLTIFHLDTDENLEGYFLSKNSSTTANANENSFHDVFLEFVNLCCGSMNRDLLCYFPNLGMSTPYILQSEGLKFLPSLKPGFLQSFKIKVGEDVELITTICLCDFRNVDFKLTDDNDQSDLGEMEFF